jgi:hypothetical protein
VVSEETPHIILGWPAFWGSFPQRGVGEAYE